MVRILVVDDAPSVRRTWRDTLANAGHEVVESSNPTEALELFDKGVRLVLTDACLPDPGGEALVRGLREVDDSVPILVLTSSMDKAAILSGSVQGIRDKSIGPDALAAWVTEILEPSVLRSEIGKRLKMALLDRRWSQKDLAGATGLNEATISRYITGKSTPNSVNLQRIARAMDMSSDAFLGGSEGACPPPLTEIQQHVLRLAESVGLRVAQPYADAAAKPSRSKRDEWIELLMHDPEAVELALRLVERIKQIVEETP